MLEGPRADSEEKHEPASDADAAVVDSLKALDLNRPIREADIIIFANGLSGTRPMRLLWSWKFVGPPDGSCVKSQQRVFDF